MAPLLVFASWRLKTDSDSLSPSRNISWPFSLACVRLTPWRHISDTLLQWTDWYLQSGFDKGVTEEQICVKIRIHPFTDWWSWRDEQSHQSLADCTVVAEGLNQAHETHFAASFNKVQRGWHMFNDEFDKFVTKHYSGRWSNSPRRKKDRKWWMRKDASLCLSEIRTNSPCSVSPHDKHQAKSILRFRERIIWHVWENIHTNLHYTLQ